MEQPSTECKGHREPWNKGKLVGQKAPLRLKEIWAIRIRLQLEKRTRELALFNLAVDSKLRSCDLLKLRGTRRHERRAHRRPRDRNAAEDPASGTVRSNPANTRIPCSMDPVFGPAPGGPPVCEPPACLFASVDTAVRADRPRVGEEDRPRPRRVWNPYTATHESLADLSPHEESARCTAAPRPFEARKHRSIPRHRGR